MPKIVDKAAVRAQILDAALQIYADGGVHAASLEKVAAAAGIGKGTLYYYFTSKEALALAIAERHFERLEAELAEVTKVSSPQQLFDALEVFYKRSDQEYNNLRVLIDIFSPGFGSGRALARARAFAETAGAALAQVLANMRTNGSLASCLEPAVLARLLVGILDGLTLHDALMGTRPEERERKNAVLVQLLKAGFSSD